jgi:cell division protein FtsB
MVQTERINSYAGRAANAARSVFNIFIKMAKPVTLWQLLSAAATILVFVATLAWNSATAYTELKAENKYLKEENEARKLDMKDINSKLDFIAIKMDNNDKDKNEKLTEILVTLQNKQNRKD